jgi:ATP-dependent helicase HrpA
MKYRDNPDHVASLREISGPAYIIEHLHECMLSDRHALAQAARKIEQRRRQHKPVDQIISRQQQRFEHSRQLSRTRASLVPGISYPEELPVSGERDKIKKLIQDHPVVILCGETGSGKTTQLPKICLELGYGISGAIGHTQPRRITARSVCNRIAEELSCEVGQQIGYKVRFDDQSSENTLIKLMTDGMLLTETQHDRYLNQYDVIIIDEAHERSLNIDFLIGYLKHIQPKRPDLKIIITSATIDPERFSKHFNDAPIIEVSGRTYPVEYQYRPLSGDDEEERDVVTAIVDAVHEVSQIDHGDILVFLSGEREIRETADALNKEGLRLTDVLPLYGRLSSSEQNRIFKPGSKRHIVLATNIAETSLTVPRIRYVIDAGQARISRYSHRLKIQQLPIERISQASANQRAGRCGRVSAGICYRLYAEEDYLSRAVFTQPEILRTNLAAVILQMHALNLGDIESFPFIEPPDSRYIRDGIRQLRELGAIDEQERLTPLGKKLSRLPIDPRVGRMLIAAGEHHCVREMLVIASALETQDPRERPLERQQQADQAHALYKDADSDFSSILMLWQFVIDNRRQLSGNQFRKLCKKQFLSWLRLREWRDTHQQLAQIVKEIGLRSEQHTASYDDVHQALLSGLLGHIGHKDEDRTYQGARNSSFMIFPGSGLKKKKPDWIVAAEIVETSQVFARTVAKVEPEWIEKAGAHLLRRQYSEPQWYARKGYVTARESVSLYGLTLASDRRVNFGSIDAEAARMVFIQQALVARDYETRAKFWKHNISLLEDIEALEHRQRRRDVLVDDDVLIAFYDERIPAGIHNQRSFDKWRKEAERKDPEILMMSRESLMHHDAIGVSQERYPDTLMIRGNQYHLHYHFNPGHEVDGIKVDVPDLLLNSLDESDFEWLVPGLLDEKIIALIKTLPKSIRKHFVPAPDYARACIEQLDIGEGSLLNQLTNHLSRMSGYDLKISDWRQELLPDHLRFHFNVLNHKGKRLMAGRDLNLLQQGQGAIAPPIESDRLDNYYEREGIVQWDIGELPETVKIDQGDHKIVMYPAVWDCSDSVSLSLCSSHEQADEQSRWGVLRLAYITLSNQRRELHKRFKLLSKDCLAYSLLPVNDQLSPSIVENACDDWLNQCIYLSFILSTSSGELPRNEKMFDDYCHGIRQKVIIVGEKVLQSMQVTFVRWRSVHDLIKSVPQDSPFYVDIQLQLSMLCYQGFISGIFSDWVHEYPRYMQALEIRLQRYQHDPQRDHRLVNVLAPYRDTYNRVVSEWLESDYDISDLEDIRWALENLRVSLFAQELGTKQPISEKRLQKLFAEYELKPEVDT